MWWRKIKMKYLAVFILSFLFFSCKKEREFPLKNFTKVEFVSYYDRTVWDTIKINGKNSIYKTLVVNGKFAFDSTFIREKIVLNKKQEKELLNLMVCDTCVLEELPAACYMPRHMIVFRDEKNKIIAYKEFCFTCVGSRSSDNVKPYNSFCMEDMEKLFKKFGIKYFADTPEQEREESKFLDSIQKIRGIK